MKILIAIDSSQFSYASLAAALSRNWPASASFRVLTVLPDDRLQTNQPAKSMTDMPGTNIRAKSLVDDAVHSLQKRFGAASVAGFIDSGDPAKCILRHAADWPADCVIVGTHDRGPLQRLILGSVSRKVVFQAPCSVLVARKLPLQSPRFSRQSVKDKILLALDGSLNSLAAQRWASKISSPGQSKFRLLTVTTPPHQSYRYQPSVVKALRELERHQEKTRKMQESLADAVSRFQKTFGPSVVCSTIIDGEPPEEIIRNASQWNADLVVIGAHRRIDLRRKILGKVARVVAMKSPCSVLVVRGYLSELPLLDQVAEQNPVRLSLASNF